MSLSDFVSKLTAVIHSNSAIPLKTGRTCVINYLLIKWRWFQLIDFSQQEFNILIVIWACL